MSMEVAVRVLSAVILAGLIPFAILISRDRLRHYRRGVLVSLENWMYRHSDPKPMPSFEVARIKYELSPRANADLGTPEDTARRGGEPEQNEVGTRDPWISYLLPVSIYAGLSALCFTTAIILSANVGFWTAPNFILSGMQTVPPNLVSDSLTIYQWNSGAMIVAGFIGAYLFTLQYLVQRVRTYELSPLSFLMASLSILEGCFIVSIARHLLPGEPPHLLIPIAFLLGYFPTFGIAYLIERLRITQLKSIEPGTYRQRFVMPTDIIDGIDMLTKFRLMGAGIRDVQNLASANPVLLYVETPYGLLAIIDWIAQAQLILALGCRTALELRSIGIRTIIDIPAMNVSDLSRKIVLEKAQPALAAEPTAQHFDAFYDLLTRDVHVRRLISFWSVMNSLVGEQAPADRPLVPHPKDRGGAGPLKGAHAEIRFGGALAEVAGS